MRFYHSEIIFRFAVTFASCDSYEGKLHLIDDKFYALIIEFLLIFAVFFLSFVLVQFIVSPLQQVFLSAALMPGSLFFIPHGIRVVATWLCGARAVVPLILAELFGTMVLWQPVIDFNAMAGSSIVGGLCVYCVFEVFRLAGINLYNDGDHRTLVNWKLLIIMASIASVLNAAAKKIFLGDVPSELGDLPIFTLFWVGDTLGVFLCLLIMIFIKRKIRV